MRGCGRVWRAASWTCGGRGSGRTLAGVIADLPEESREVVILYYREGSSAKHVADLLGIEESMRSIEQRLTRLEERLGALPREAITTLRGLIGIGRRPDRDQLATHAAALHGGTVEAGAGLAVEEQPRLVQQGFLPVFGLYLYHLSGGLVSPSNISTCFPSR